MARLAAWGLLLLLVGAVVSQIIVPVVHAYAVARSDLALKKELIAKLVAQNSRLRGGTSKVDELGAYLRQEGFLLRSIDAGLASAEVRDYFAEAVRASEGAVQSTQNLPLRHAGPLQGTTLRVSMTATLEQLYGLLHRLESQRPFLFVDTLSIQSQATGRAVASRGALLRIQMNVSGYVLPGDGS